MPQHMISLLKILLAAAPTSKAKTESVNILADVLPTAEASAENCTSALQGVLLAADINRHKVNSPFHIEVKLRIERTKLSFSFNMITQPLRIRFTGSFGEGDLGYFAVAIETRKDFTLSSVRVHRPTINVRQLYSACVEIFQSECCVLCSCEAHVGSIRVPEGRS